MEVKTDRPIRVAIFGHYIPIYRKGVFEKLSSFNDIQLTVYGTSNFPIGLQLIKSDEVSFNLQNIRTILFAIPFTDKTLSIQPASLIKILSMSHDVYIMPNTMSYLDVWMNLIIARLLSRPICLWGQGKGSIKGTAADRIRKTFMNLADALIFYTENGLETWCKAGIEKEKLFVAYNALDTGSSAKIQSTISAQDVEEFLRVQGLKEKKLIIYSGRLLKNKRPDLLVDAMTRIARQVPEAHAVIIGDGVMRENVKSRVLDCGLEQRVSLTGAIFSEEKIAYYLMAGKVAVMPAMAGLAVQQAFAYGLPIVVGDDMRSHGPEVELLQEGETGLFFKDGSSADLADKVISILLNEEKRLIMSSNAKKIIEDRYNINNMAAGIAQAIRYAYSRKVSF